MSDAPSCRQILAGGARCPEPQRGLIHWPGGDEPLSCCAMHIEKARDVASVLGFVQQVTSWYGGRCCEVNGGDGAEHQSSSSSENRCAASSLSGSAGCVAREAPPARETPPAIDVTKSPIARALYSHGPCSAATIAAVSEDEHAPRKLAEMVSAGLVSIRNIGEVTLFVLRGNGVG